VFSAHDCLVIEIKDYEAVQDVISYVIEDLFTYDNVTQFWQQFRQYIPASKIKKFDQLTTIDKNKFEKLISEVSKNKSLFVLN
jgi:hypothetical protein